MTTPIFVVTGPPRSGTSLMMSLLRAAGLPILADESRPADASNPNGYFEFTPVKGSARSSQWVESATGQAVKVIDRILPTLPRDRPYRVIIMERPAQEVIASQNRMLTRLGEPQGELPTARLEEMLTIQVAKTRALLAEEDCFDWVSVAYPELIEFPHDRCQQILEFIGFDDPNGDRANRMVARIDTQLYRERASAK